VSQPPETHPEEAPRDPAGGIRLPRNEDVARGVGGHGVAKVVVRAAEVAAPYVPAGRAQLRYEAVPAAAVAGVPPPRDPAGGRRVPRDEDVARGVGGHARGTVPAPAAEVAAPVEIRVDDQLPRGVVASGQLEAVRRFIQQDEPPGDGDPLAGELLVDVRGVVDEPAPVGAQVHHQRPVVGEAQPGDAVVGDPDGGVVRAGGDVELVLEVVPPAPGVQVDAVVEPLVGHDLVGWHVLAPLRRIAHEEVESSLRLLQADGPDRVGSIERGREAKALDLARLLRKGVRTLFSALGVVLGGGDFAEQLEDRPAVRVGDVGTLSPVDEADRRIGPLALVLDEHRRRRVKQLDGLLRRRGIQQETRLQRFEDRAWTDVDGSCPIHDDLLLRSRIQHELKRPPDKATKRSRTAARCPPWGHPAVYHGLVECKAL